MKTDYAALLYQFLNSGKPGALVSTEAFESTRQGFYRAKKLDPAFLPITIAQSRKDPTKILLINKTRNPDAQEE